MDVSQNSQVWPKKISTEEGICAHIKLMFSGFRQRFSTIAAPYNHLECFQIKPMQGPTSRDVGVIRLGPSISIFRDSLGSSNVQLELGTTKWTSF